MVDALLDRTEAEAAYAASEGAEQVLALLDRAHRMLCEMEGASGYFAAASAFLPDVISDLQAMKDAADEAIREYDVRQAYGRGPSRVALVSEGGMGL